MKNIYILLFGLTTLACVPTLHVEPTKAANPVFQLATPNMIFEDILFQNSEKVKLFLSLEGVTIHYTTDGSEPTATSQRYIEPIQINTSCELKAKAFHSDFKPSDEVSQRFIKISKSVTIKNIKISPLPTESYPGEAEELMDLKKGSLDFREKVWLGFKSDVVVTAEFEKSTTFQKLIISSISSTGAWIMPPSGIELAISDDGKNFKTIATRKIPLLQEDETAQLVFPQINLEKAIQTKFIQIKIFSAGKLPEWHSGTGYPSWLFLDEIIFE